MGISGHTILKGAAVKDSSASSFVAVGRTWVNASSQYRALIAGFEYVRGGHDRNFAASSGLWGRSLFDFSGAGLDNLCTSVVYTNTGFVAACRSLTSSHLYKIYLVKFDEYGSLVTAFGTNGIKDTGIGGSTDDGLVRGVAYDSTNARVVVVGANGGLTARTLRPFIATFNATTGAQVGSTTLITANGGGSFYGTAVGVAVDSTPYYYVASTETAADHHFYVNQFDTSLAQTGGSWGANPDFTTATSGGAADSVPSGIAVIGTNIVTVGGNRINTSSAWRCALTAHKIADGTLDTAFGDMNSTMSSNYTTTDNQGISLFTNNISRDCILNATATPPSGSTINVTGTIYNGTNYDVLSASLTSAGVLNSGFGTSGIRTSTVGTADEVANSVLYMQGAATHFYGVGRSQDATASNYNGALTTKLTVADGTFATTGSNTWTAIPIAGAPSQRRSSMSVWTGYKFITWGGYSMSGFTNLNSGGIYDPVANSWSNTTVTGAPAPRRFSSTAWTGTKMVVVGGSLNASVVNTGGVYDAAADSWSNTTTTGAPVARTGATSVWTGTSLISWGGATNLIENAFTNLGGIYNPSSDSWTNTTTVGAPTARNNPAAFWIGDRMLVFGGVTSGSVLVNTGGIYNPVTDSWTSTTIAGAPAGVGSPNAVWTGTELIVWGVNFGNTGGKYNPTTNSWTNTNTTSAPAYRSSDLNVWSGYRFLSWGGYSTTNTGRVYDPVNNSWGSTATAGAPAGRYNHTGQWSGSNIFVWGGRDGGGALNTGGMYWP